MSPETQNQKIVNNQFYSFLFLKTGEEHNSQNFYVNFLAGDVPKCVHFVQWRTLSKPRVLECSHLKYLIYLLLSTLFDYEMQS